MSLCRTCARRATCTRPCPALEKYLRIAADRTRGPASDPARANVAYEARRRLAEITDGRTRLRTIARLYYERGFTQDQIALILRCPRSTVASRLARIRARLRRPSSG